MRDYFVYNMQCIYMIPYYISVLMRYWMRFTVKLRSKGPGRKRNRPIKEIISVPISYFPIYFYIRVNIKLQLNWTNTNKAQLQIRFFRCIHTSHIRESKTRNIDIFDLVRCALYYWAGQSVRPLVMQPCQQVTKPLCIAILHENTLLTLWAQI